MRNINETKEFVWNLATRDLAEAMNQTSAMLPHDRDEFSFAGLTPAASQLVNAPRVAESPVNFECRLSQCIQLTGADGTPVDTWLVLGRWSVSILPKRCWKRGYTRRLNRSPSCVRVGRRRIMASVMKTGLIWCARARISNRLYQSRTVFRSYPDVAAVQMTPQKAGC